MYLRMLHMFVPILVDVFNWFTIPGSIAKDVITLLKKSGRHVWEDLDGYRPITLLNTDNSVRGDNLYLVRKVLVGLKDDTKAALINLDQSKAYDMVDHRFLATVLETTGFKPDFHKWISMLYHNPQVVVQVNRERLEAFALER